MTASGSCVRATLPPARVLAAGGGRAGDHLHVVPVARPEPVARVRLRSGRLLTDHAAQLDPGAGRDVPGGDPGAGETKTRSAPLPSLSVNVSPPPVVRRGPSRTRPRTTTRSASSASPNAAGGTPVGRRLGLRPEDDGRRRDPEAHHPRFRGARAGQLDQLAAAQAWRSPNWRGSGSLRSRPPRRRSPPRPGRWAGSPRRGSAGASPSSASRASAMGTSGPAAGRRRRRGACGDGGDLRGDGVGSGVAGRATVQRPRRLVAGPGSRRFRFPRSPAARPRR